MSACWLELEDSFELLGKAMLAPWDGDIESGIITHPAAWDDLGPASHASPWRHAVMCCARPPLADSSASAPPTLTGEPLGQLGCIYLHRFTLETDVAEPLNRWLHDLASREVEQGHADAASNVGGFHSRRDLWARPEVQSSGLTQLISGAVDRAAHVEAALLAGAGSEAAGQVAEAVGQAQVAGGAPSTHGQSSYESCVSEADPPPAPGAEPAVEAWLNVLKAGNWNTLHTHPGSTFSATCDPTTWPACHAATAHT